MTMSFRRPRLPRETASLLAGGLPHSLRAQFTLAVSMLTLLIVVGSLAAFFSQRSSTGTTLRLTQDRLARMQQAQDVVQRTLLIERDADRLLWTRSPSKVRKSFAAIVTQTTELDRLVAGFANAHDDPVELGLLQSAQRFRNTANLVAQLRESALQSELDFTHLLLQRTAGPQGRRVRPGSAPARSTTR